MSLERPRGRKLTQLVPHHILRDIDRDKLLPVVHGDGEAHELRQDRRAARPRAHHLLLVRRPERIHLLLQMVVCEWSFFYGSAHVVISSCSSASRSTYRY